MIMTLKQQFIIHFYDNFYKTISRKIFLKIEPQMAKLNNCKETLFSYSNSLEIKHLPLLISKKTTYNGQFVGFKY